MRAAHFFAIPTHSYQYHETYNGCEKNCSQYMHSKTTKRKDRLKAFYYEIKKLIVAMSTVKFDELHI